MAEKKMLRSDQCEFDQLHVIDFLHTAEAVGFLGG